ncbi:MAG: hypothetical protein IT426_20770 [Pirellulales bacterium]|nr:hypothetical protein [Pirellulales bacterium]
MNAGDTILIDEPGTSYDSHLWMVISDPKQDDRCLIVNFTSWRADEDQACVVEAGEHPYIKHRTCVKFRGAKLVPIATLDACLGSGGLVPHSPLSANLLAKIRNAVPNSRISIDHAHVLMDQGLVSLD